MSEPAFDPPADPATLEAATWLARRNDGLSVDGEAQFRAWICSDPGNRRAWEFATRVWELAGRSAAHPDIIRLRADALAMGYASKQRRLVWRHAAVAAMVLLAGAAPIYLLWPDAKDPEVQLAAAQPRILSTGIGERATFTLPDGTALTLNTRSRAAIEYAGHKRSVTLLAGQALFEVAKDPTRPFTVHAGDRDITALGTEFDVRLYSGGQVRVALVEGKVKVTKRLLEPQAAIAAKAQAPSAPSTVQFLEPGEQLQTSNAREVSVRPVDPARLTSWRDGRIVFADTALIDAVNEVNRYTAKPIRIADPALLSLRISGTFRTGQSAGFVTAMTEYFPVTARDEGDRIEFHVAR